MILYIPINKVTWGALCGPGLSSKYLQVFQCLLLLMLLQGIKCSNTAHENFFHNIFRPLNFCFESPRDVYPVYLTVVGYIATQRFFALALFDSFTMLFQYNNLHRQ